MHGWSVVCCVRGTRGQVKRPSSVARENVLGRFEEARKKGSLSSLSENLEIWPLLMILLLSSSAVVGGWTGQFLGRSFRFSG